jgi:UDP-N-acetylmuramoyl-L-alanyl-D-glutamate--2,6-diaminopimelate ligase
LAFSLAHLLEGAGTFVPAIAIKGISADSRAIAAGEAFFALPGTRAHGNVFAAQAAARGAAAIITDTRLDSDPGIPVVVVEDVRAGFARAASRLSPQPKVAVAVTGTNGKTSIASFVRQIWAENGWKAASLGTLGIDRGDGNIEAGALTTPDSLTLHQGLAALKAEGFDHVSLEASSHGLDQRRLDGMRFDAVAYTNLSRDHLDYHASMEAYRDAKLRLFKDLLKPGGAAVVNVDDAMHPAFLFAALDGGARLMTVGREGAFIEISGVEREGYGQRVTGRLVGEPISFYLPLTGAFQVSNAVVAVALAIATDVPADTALRALESLKGAKGRLELVGQHNGAAIFIDYSHKPVALETALAALRPYAQNRLSVVFGCGGDRDKGKRPMMGAIAVQNADQVIVTDDNPRTEEAATIRAEVLAGAPGAREIGGRGEAIAQAVAELQPGDVLLIAGKGHEDYQIIGTTKHHFSDHEQVAAAIGTR